MRKKRPLEERFWNKVSIVPDETSCWDWTGSPSGFHYGMIGLNGSYIRTHRASWEMHFGQIPNGLCVLHKCDNRRCVRPDHIFLGTKSSNNADRYIKGRDARGVRNGRSVLNDEIVIKIKRLYRPNRVFGARKIAAKLGLNYSTVNGVVGGVNWKWL